MFGTWKYDPETDQVQNIRKAYDPITARSSQHQACNRCHEKKLKCSGEEDGCERCLAHNLTCDYERSSSRASRRGRRHRGRSGEEPRLDHSPASSHAATPPAQAFASSSRLSPHPPHSPSATYSGHPHLRASSPLSASASHSPMSQEYLDRFDFSTLPGSGAFDMTGLSPSYGRDAGAYMPMPTTVPGGGTYVTGAPLASASPAFHYPDVSPGAFTPQSGYTGGSWAQVPHAHGSRRLVSSSAGVPSPNLATAEPGGYYDPDYAYQQHDQSYDQRYWDQGN